MRTLALALTLLALGISPAAAQSAKRAAGAVIEIEPSEHDFGRARQDQELVHDFVVTNTGTEDLVLSKIVTACGCTAAVAAETIVPPGGSTTLRVTLETRKYKGRIERSVSMASNDRRRVATVRVKAFVEVPEP
jgi:hypothetical protein